LGQVTD